MTAVYFKMWNALTTAPDPEVYIPEWPAVVGQMCSGKPITQGLERGSVVWTAMTIAEYIALKAAYDTNKDTSGTFVIPPSATGSWTSWRSVTAYVAGAPTGEWRGRVVQNVTVQLVITA